MKKVKKIQLVLWLVLFANLTVAFIKIVIGYLIKSAGVMTDGLHSITDMSSNIIGLIGIHFAYKPGDKKHPYGHRKIENLAGLLIALLLLILAIKQSADAIKRFFHPLPLEISLLSLLLLILSLIINIFIAYYEYKQGKALNSTILISDSIHTKSDIFISLGVLTTLIAVKLGLPAFIDSVASLIVSVFILAAAYEIFKRTSGPLLDQAILDEDKIKEIVLSFHEVKDVHDIKSRGTEDDVYLDFHIIIDPSISFMESQLTDSIEKKLKSNFCENMNINIRLEPCPLWENDHS